MRLLCVVEFENILSLFQHLYTSSPFSEHLSLDMREVPPGEPPKRPNPDAPIDPDVSVDRNMEEATMMWVIGPSIAALLVCLCLILVFIIKK
jgi:netrin-G3 ligand